MACLSFNGNKIITTGGGGMMVTDNPEFAARARYLTTQAKDDPLEYIHNEMGFNYRLTNLQAALGVAQMEVLDEYVARKRRIAERYQKAFADRPGIRMLTEADWAFSTYWLSTVLIDEHEAGAEQPRVAAASRRPSAFKRGRSGSRCTKARASRTCRRASARSRINCSRDALSLPSSVGLDRRAARPRD